MEYRGVLAVTSRFKTRLRFCYCSPRPSMSCARRCVIRVRALGFGAMDRQTALQQLARKRLLKFLVLEADSSV
jgi:hypothetical protein